MIRKTIVMQGRRVAMAACGLLIGASVLQSCKDDDVLTGQPSWLGNSIYERLQEDGSYATTLRLIDDLDMKDVLGHTGSKTLFVADDAAFAEWFKSNSWGVSSYEQLTDAQKRLLLNNSMVNNAYLIELMSNAYLNDALQDGRAMRRETASGIYDSVYVMKPSEMPNTKAWAYYKATNKSIPIFRDETAAPMIHFLPAYMNYNKITSEDLAILTNGQATSANEAWVNGKQVVERDITCKNGYIQKMSGVIESSPNMAQIIHQHAQMSKWAELIDRFSAPYFSAANMREYNRIYNNEDSVFMMHYFNDYAGGGARTTTPSGEAVKATLKFDPGWNQYRVDIEGYDLHHDAAAMIVPTDAALDRWWNKEGKDLQDEYKEWDSIPDATLAKLIRVNMLPTFTEAVPSKFQNVLNDAKEVLGITKEDIDSCFMGCNGVVYLVDSVFTPAEFASVAYPALAHTSTMNVIYWVIDQRNFLPYLLSMDSKYALILPDNDAMMLYIDPASYGNGVDSETGNPMMQIFEFYYDEKRPEGSRVQARRYNVMADADGNITKTSQTPAQSAVAQNVIQKSVDDLMDQLIIVLADKNKNLEDYVNEGYTLFKTKGGSLIRVTKADGNHLSFEGGWQMEHNGRKDNSTAEFQKSNGRSYMVHSQMPLTAEKSLYMTLREHQEYRGFLNLLANDYCDLLSVKLNNKYTPSNAKNGNQNFRLFDNYNYTVFIPSTDAIEQLQAEKKLPTWDELEESFADADDEGARHDYLSVLDSICAAEHWYRPNASEASKDSTQKKVKTCMTAIVSNFIRYHVMDRSVAIGMAPEANAAGNTFESMMRNPETGRFFSLEANFDQNSLSVTDIMGNTRNVARNEGLYNNIIREYWFEGSGNSARLFMGSNAVAHLISQPLFYQEMKPWREVVAEYLKNN